MGEKKQTWRQPCPHTVSVVSSTGPEKGPICFSMATPRFPQQQLPEAVSAKWVVNHIQDRCCFYVFPNCLNTKVWDMMALQLHSKYASQDSSVHICPYILLLCGLIRLYYNLCAEKRTHMQRVINSSAQSIHCSPPPPNERSSCAPVLKESNELFPSSLRLFEKAAVTEWHWRTLAQ